MTNDARARKGATWKRVVAGFAIAAATTVAGAGMADAAAPQSAPKPAASTGTTATTGTTGTPGTPGTTGTIRVASAQSGIRW